MLICFHFTSDFLFYHSPRVLPTDFSAPASCVFICFRTFWLYSMLFFSVRQTFFFRSRLLFRIWSGFFIFHFFCPIFPIIQMLNQISAAAAKSPAIPFHVISSAIKIVSIIILPLSFSDYNFPDALFHFWDNLKK